MLRIVRRGQAGQDVTSPASGAVKKKYRGRVYTAPSGLAIARLFVCNYGVLRYNFHMVRELKFPPMPEPPENDDSKKDDTGTTEGNSKVIDISEKLNKEVVITSVHGLDSEVQGTLSQSQLLSMIEPGSMRLIKTIERLEALVAEMTTRRKIESMEKNKDQISAYSDAEIINELRNNMEKDWKKKPMFFWVLIQIARRKNLKI